MVCEALERWRKSGEIDPEILMDVLYAPIYMRLLIGHAPLDDRFTIDLQNFLFPLLELSNARRSIQERDK